MYKWLFLLNITIYKGFEMTLESQTYIITIILISAVFFQVTSRLCDMY